jgi:hypothetical protein
MFDCIATERKEQAKITKIAKLSNPREQLSEHFHLKEKQLIVSCLQIHRSLSLKWHHV